MDHARNSQESLVVCRLKKNVDFRGNQSCNGFAEESAERNRMMETYAAECSKKTSSSSASYSNEQQLDSVSNDDSENKLSNNSATPAAESSSRHDPGLLDDLCQGFGFSDDYYADILNDDIIKLDETCLTTTATVDVIPKANVGEAAAAGDGVADGEEELPLWLMSQQGTASRRVKLGRVGSVVVAAEERQRKAAAGKKKEKRWDVGVVMLLCVLMVVGLVGMLVWLQGKGRAVELVRRTAHLSSLAFRSHRGNCRA
ncbi:hypothetical protein LINGRAHAP2_LOCUS20887 [Linum grandiflorum]